MSANVPPMTLSITQLNTSNKDQFVGFLADIFEHSPWVPQRTWAQAPFSSVLELHKKMTTTVQTATRDEKIALLRAHPRLAGKKAQSGQLSKHSSNEQSAVGFNALSTKELLTVQQLNDDYSNKFGWPFIIAVLDNTKDDIFRKWQQRLNNSLETELTHCLEQVFLIAKLRLEALTGESLL